MHVSVWQKPLQYCKVISLQLIKINGKKLKKENNSNNINISKKYLYGGAIHLCSEVYKSSNNLTKQCSFGTFLGSLTFLLLNLHNEL